MFSTSARNAAHYSGVASTASSPSSSDSGMQMLYVLAGALMAAGGNPFLDKTLEQVPAFDQGGSTNV